MIEANTHPQAGDRAATPAWRATVGRWWRAGQERSLVLRRRGVDHVRLPLNLVVLFSLVLAASSWPVLVLAVVAALLAQVEFVVQRDSSG